METGLDPRRVYRQNLALPQRSSRGCLSRDSEVARGGCISHGDRALDAYESLEELPSIEPWAGKGATLGEQLLQWDARRKSLIELGAYLANRRLEGRCSVGDQQEGLLQARRGQVVGAERSGE